MTPPSPTSTAHRIDLRAVGVQLGGNEILSGIHLRLWAGELCALIGPSGAGKSTLMKVLLGLQRPSAGQVSGTDRGRPVGYVPQDDALHTTLTVGDCLGYAAELRLADHSPEARHKRLAEVVASVGLGDRLDLRIKKLSGGQRKRVSVAMELLTEPDMLILDEPTSGLDPGLEARMMGLFGAVARQGRVVLVATHAMSSIERCQALVVLVAGRVAFFGPPVHALQFFRTRSYEGLFNQLPKQPPRAWARSCRDDPVCAAFLRRERPAIGGPKP